jgi:hypothetical protein
MSDWRRREVIAEMWRIRGTSEQYRPVGVPERQAAVTAIGVDHRPHRMLTRGG